MFICLFVYCSLWQWCTFNFSSFVRSNRGNLTITSSRQPLFVGDSIYLPSLFFRIAFCITDVSLSYDALPFSCLFRCALKEVWRSSQRDGTAVGDLTIITGVGRGSLHAFHPVVSVFCFLSSSVLVVPPLRALPKLCCSLCFAHRSSTDAEPLLW